MGRLQLLRHNRDSLKFERVAAAAVSLKICADLHCTSHRLSPVRYLDMASRLAASACLQARVSETLGFERGVEATRLRGVSLFHKPVGHLEEPAVFVEMTTAGTPAA